MNLHKFQAQLEQLPVPDDVAGILVPGEQAFRAFKTFRDSAIFTDRRLIVRDSQGLTGKKVEIYSLPYSAINMWSSENAGKLLDFNAEVELWTKAGHIKIKIGKGCDVRAIDMLIAKCGYWIRFQPTAGQALIKRTPQVG